MIFVNCLYVDAFTAKISPLCWGSALRIVKAPDFLAIENAKTQMSPGVRTVAGPCLPTPTFVTR